MKTVKKLKIFIKLAFQASPSYFFLLIFGSLLSSFQVLANVIIPKFLIDELLDLQQTGALSTNWQSFSFIDFLNYFHVVLLFGALVVLFNVVFGAINRTYIRFLDVKNTYMTHKLPEIMAKKIMSVPYSYLEDPYYLDLKERAVFACTNQSAIANLVHFLAKSIESILTLAGLITIMLTLSSLLALFLLVTVFITIFIRSRFNKYLVQFYNDLIPINRRYGYYMNFAYDPRFAKDIRIFDANEMLSNELKKYNKMNYDYFLDNRRKEAKMSSLIRFINVIQSSVIYLYIALRTAGRIWGTQISLGSFSMYVNGALRFSTVTTDLFGQLLELNQTLRYLDPFMEFMTIEDERRSTSDKILEEIETIRFENVSFKYPRTENFVLEDISFTVSKGEKISIVGLNGAGKTTLIKLLCRLYLPTAGHIYINDIDIFDYDYDSYIERIAAVFQDFQIFAYSIKKNVIGKKDLNQEKIDSIFNQIGIKEKVDSLPEGDETPLNKELDENGIELSGGQNQKIAIARALYKDAGLIILDEPTSALDPLSEADIYKNFNDLVQNKTAFYISHRMSSSIFCDRIVIIDHGNIVDIDSHANLMKKTDSLYYKLFQAQAKHYEN